MKRLISLILCLLILVPLSTAAFATEGVYVVDELERLEESKKNELNETAKNLKAKYGIAVFLAYVKGHADDVALESIVGEEKDYVLLLLGERGTRIYVGGKGAEVFSADEDRDRLGYVHDEQDEWCDGVSRYLEVTEEYFADAFAESDPETEPEETIGASDPAPETSSEKGEAETPPFPSIYLIIAVSALVLAVVLLFFIRKKKA